MKDGIAKYGNVFSKEYCQELVDYYESNSEQAYQGIGTGDHLGHNLYLSERKYVDFILEKIKEVLKEYVKDYTFGQFSGDDGYLLRKIYGATKFHANGLFGSHDDGKLRSVGLTIGLNNDYEGGEYEFPNQELTTTLQQGEVLIYPVYYTHPHSVSAPKGYRYVVHTYLNQ